MSMIIYIFHKTLRVPEGPYFTKIGQFLFDSLNCSFILPFLICFASLFLLPNHLER